MFSVSGMTCGSRIVRGKNGYVLIGWDNVHIDLSVTSEYKTFKRQSHSLELTLDHLTPRRSTYLSSEWRWMVDGLGKAIIKV